MSTTIQKDRMLQFRGQDLFDRGGDKIGKVEEIYLDAETNEPEWALVHTGLFGTKQTFVPLRDAAETDGALRVGVDKQAVKDAPKVDPDGRLSESEERELYRHYGLEWGHDADPDAAGRERAGIGDGDVDTRGSFGGAPPTGDDVSGPETDNAMTRSEEEVRVGTTERERGRARLRKYVVTDEVQQTVPVRREEIRVEREPITDANVDQATTGKDISEEEHEIVLHEEEAVAEKRVVPKERVRLDKDVEVEEQTVSEDVRREEIDMEGDVEGRGRR